jgi:hypothetical protein
MAAAARCAARREQRARGADRAIRLCRELSLPQPCTAHSYLTFNISSVNWFVIDAQIESCSACLLSSLDQ